MAIAARRPAQADHFLRRARTPPPGLRNANIPYITSHAAFRFRRSNFSTFRRRPAKPPRGVVIFTVIPAPPTVIPAPSTVIPAQAGIYACRLHYRSRGCTTLDSGASRNDGCKGIAMMKTCAGLR